MTPSQWLKALRAVAGVFPSTEKRNHGGAGGGPNGWKTLRKLFMMNVPNWKSTILVGKGKVKNFLTAGKEHLRREAISAQKKDFMQSQGFLAVEEDLEHLQKDPRGDSTSQYSREVQRLFLASLSEEDRSFMEASEGLGNSQKAEVAWLEKKGYAYTEVDVSSWLYD
ncbi:unnamed protein product [Symbiodinium pilosum]|uniref:Uncharacterized protein n=1 Tax=Symbiodinium pilosum TaxID=2952 RepID=A0A812S760_SYMPI|nr:unnamed protein product [Symbiodinium pilosum]